MSNSWPPGASGLRTYRTTLTTSGSFTVPVNVTLINRRCKGGGGGSGGAGGSTFVDAGGGSATTFSGLSAAGGAGGKSAGSGSNLSGVAGSAAAANSGQAGTPGRFMTSTGYFEGAWGTDGAELHDFLAVTPGQVISYVIGAGGAGGTSNVVSGGAGGSGFITLEWQA